MSGKGKYTTFNAPASPRKSFLEKCYAGDSSVTPPFQGMDQTKAIDPKNVDSAVARGNAILRAAASGGITAGDVGHFPTGVDLSYTGATATVSIPDKVAGSEDSWKKPGDPANSYVPDITSPGPGKTEGIDKAVNPKISSADIKQNIVPGTDDNTKNPSDAGTKLYDANTLGADTIPGKSGV